MVGKHEKVLLRKVDLTKKDSAVEQQAIGEYKVDGIPHINVYDGKGALIEAALGSDIGAIEKAVSKALGN